MKKESNKLAITVFVLAFVGSLSVTVIVLQYAHATAAIAPPQSNQTNQTLPNATALIANQTIANVTASPLNVTILGTNALLNFDPTGLNSNLQVIGEVFNNGTEPINASTLIIPATVYDVNGTIVGESITFPDLTVIEKNNSSPFKATFFDTDVKFGVLNALFYKVQAANESNGGLVPPPPPLALGGVVPGGVPFGAFPGGPLMGPILPPPGGLIPGPGIPGNETCYDAYPDFCLPGPPPPKLNCPDIPINQHNFTVLLRIGDPLGFDADKDGIGCDLESAPTNQTMTNQTLGNQSQLEGPDESCLFDASQPKCAAVNGECPDGFNMNEAGDCFPQHSQCPDGYHSQEDDETGQCYPDSQSCDSGYILDPDFPTCGKQADICKEHPDLNQCTDLIAKQEAITSNDDNQSSTDNGQEQEEKDQGQTGQSQIQAGGSSITTTTGQEQEVEEEEDVVEQEEGDREDD